MGLIDQFEGGVIKLWCNPRPERKRKKNDSHEIDTESRVKFSDKFSLKPRGKSMK